MKINSVPIVNRVKSYGFSTNKLYEFMSCGVLKNIGEVTLAVIIAINLRIMKTL